MIIIITIIIIIIIIIKYVTMDGDNEKKVKKEHSKAITIH